MERSNHKQKISGLSFRDLSLVSEDNEEYILLDSDISDERDLSRIRRWFRFHQGDTTLIKVFAFIVDLVVCLF